MTAFLGVWVTTLAIAAMAVDHLIGDDPGLEDVPTFLIASAASLALAALLFGFVVPRTRTIESAASRGLVCSLLALVGLPLSLWLGLPFVLAGAGVSLGLGGRAGPRKRLATLAVVLGTIVLAVATAAYGYEAARKLS